MARARQWTEAEIERLRLVCLQGATLVKAAAALGRPVSSVRAKAKANGIRWAPRPKVRGPAPAPEAQVLAPKPSPPGPMRLAPGATPFIQPPSKAQLMSRRGF